MTTGKRLIGNVDNYVWACYKLRDNTERDRCSDRMKRIRRVVSKKCRIALKRQLREETIDL